MHCKIFILSQSSACVNALVLTIFFFFYPIHNMAVHSVSITWWLMVTSATFLCPLSIPSYFGETIFISIWENHFSLYIQHSDSEGLDPISWLQRWAHDITFPISIFSLSWSKCLILNYLRVNNGIFKYTLQHISCLFVCFFTLVELSANCCRKNSDQQKCLLYGIYHANFPASLFIY